MYVLYTCKYPTLLPCSVTYMYAHTCMHVGGGMGLYIHHGVWAWALCWHCFPGIPVDPATLQEDPVLCQQGSGDKSIRLVLSQRPRHWARRNHYNNIFTCIENVFKCICCKNLWLSCIIIIIHANWACTGMFYGWIILNSWDETLHLAISVIMGVKKVWWGSMCLNHPELVQNHPAYLVFPVTL